MRVVLASGNPGKLRELSALLIESGIELVAQSDLGIDIAEETGRTLLENALIKARHAATQSGLAAIADDSGLEVDALGGRPGVHSARYAGPDANPAANNAKLLAELAQVAESKRTARFRCVLVLLRSPTEPAPLSCEGVWEGRIGFSPAGENGFGYDPLFLVGDLGLTAAQLAPELKNQLSHRGQALHKLVAEIRNTGAARLG